MISEQLQFYTKASRRHLGRHRLNENFEYLKPGKSFQKRVRLTSLRRAAAMTSIRGASRELLSSIDEFFFDYFLKTPALEYSVGDFTM